MKQKEDDARYTVGSGCLSLNWTIKTGMNVKIHVYCTSACLVPRTYKLPVIKYRINLESLKNIKHIKQLKESKFTEHKNTQGDIMKYPKYCILQPQKEVCGWWRRQHSRFHLPFPQISTLVLTCSTH